MHQQQLGLMGSTSRLRSSTSKKPPEPLRRTVADCLSAPTSSLASNSIASSSVASATSANNTSNPTFGGTEAWRTLRDYLASFDTIDMAYTVILEHTIAERERSPAVVSRCIVLLKRFLLRYKPSEEILQQIDRFCLNMIAECDAYPNKRISPLSKPPNHQSNPSMNSSVFIVSTFSSESLVKSLNYMRSLVAQHLPRGSFQSGSFSAVSNASKQSLLSLSSLLRKSFNAHVSPANDPEPPDGRTISAMPELALSNLKTMEENENYDYLAVDFIKWRWFGNNSVDSGRIFEFQEVNTRNILEMGAAALLVGDMKSKRKNEMAKHFGCDEFPFLDQMLQLSSVTKTNDSNSVIPHLRAITASKRNKAGPRQIWDESTASTFKPRAKPLFHYRHYSEQQPLKLNPTEVCEVIAAVSSEAYTANATQQLGHNIKKASIDVAVSVLVKLIIDMYVQDSDSAAPLFLSMLEEMVNSDIVACRIRALDLLLNLGVHAQLLEPITIDDSESYEDGFLREPRLHSKDLLNKIEALSAITTFESWIMNLLYDILLLLIQREEKEESVWAAALSCLLFFVCDRGKILKKRLHGLDIRVIKAFLETSRCNSWAELVHSKLICILTNMFYLPHDLTDNEVLKRSSFRINQIDLIGGIDFIFFEYSLATLREERRNLYAVLFDYLLHQINDACILAGVSGYSDDEVQPIATLLALADAPEAFYISVKLGVEGIGELLRSSISTALNRFPSNERLNMLLKRLTENFDSLISSFYHVEKEFAHLEQKTKSFMLSVSVDNAVISDPQVKSAWVSLHSLLHSDRIACRRNGYIWLGDLLTAEITEGNEPNICFNIQELQRKISNAGSPDPIDSTAIPLSLRLMCGLLKSKKSVIRAGFLYVLDRLLIQCKLLLDDVNVQLESDSGNVTKSQLDKANVVIDLMSSALSLVAQRPETDRINTLKMCDILFSQLCLKVPNELPVPAIVNMGINDETDTQVRDKLVEENDNDAKEYTLKCDTASMAAMLLRGRAVIPMKLVARIPTILFYWPLLHLAVAATDNIALGVAVGSQRRGNLPGATSDLRAALLLLLICKCTMDPSAFGDVGGEEFFRELLDDTDSRVAYFSAAFLLKRMMTDNPDEYQHMLQNLIFKAQQSNNEKLLENPYLQMRGILQLSSDGL